MAPDRWQQIVTLCGAALELPAANREAFLSANCGEDAALRAEVESLLSVAAKPGILPSAVTADLFTPSGVIGGRFKIVRWIGRGGMGEVYETKDLHLGESVALKTIRPDIASATNSAERFKREIQIAKRVTHPNVCRIYDVGFHPSSADPNARLFLTMELLRGETLAHRLASGPMTTSEAFPLIEQLAEALEAAHNAGVIHRDFKSSNVMLTTHQGRTRAVIMDFGLARTFDNAEGPAENPVTRSRDLAGTPEYMAPEQLTRDPVTAAADIYAFGIVIYEVVTGRRPFQGDTPFEAAVRRLYETPTAPRQLVPDLDPRWDKAILRCLSRRPEDRFQNTSELLSALSEKRVAKQKARPWKRLVVIGAAIVILAAFVVTLRLPKRNSAVPAEWLQLTNFSDSATDPALSPDGQMLAFKRGGLWFMNPGQIYIKLLPDGAPVQLTHDSSSKMSPVFSPDGSSVVYSVRRPGSNDWEVWRASVWSGGGEPRLFLSNAEGLAWIDKQHILFSEIKERPPVMAVVASTESRTAAHDVYVPRNPDWMAHFSTLSPDRKNVLIVEMQPGPSRNFSDFFPCRMVPFDGSSSGRQVGPVPGHCIAAAWSPDGKWMYFSARVDDKFHLWRQRADRGKAEMITSGPTEEEGLALTTDGKFAITSVGVDHTTVWIHDATGEHQISGEGLAVAPKFVPDGSGIYYLSPPDLWLTDLRSGHAEHVLPGVAIAEYAVSPDGKGVAYTTPEGSLWYSPIDRRTPPRLLAARGIRPEFTRSGDILFRMATVLYRIRFDGTDLRQVPGNPGDEDHNIPALSPDEKWSTRVTGQELLLAEARNGGRPVVLCAQCTAGWSLDGRFFWIALRPLGGQDGVTGLFPLKNQSMFPPLPQSGVNTRADLTKIPGVQIVSTQTVSPAPDGTSYAFVKQESRWNLYRIPLP
jgi:serine/threonine protein kinase